MTKTDAFKAENKSESGAAARQEERRRAEEQRAERDD